MKFLIIGHLLRLYPRNGEYFVDVGVPGASKYLLQFGEIDMTDIMIPEVSDLKYAFAPTKYDDGHWRGQFILHGKVQEIDLTKVLGLGIEFKLTEEDAPMLAICLERVGGWRYTIYAAWMEARQNKDELERMFKAWHSGKYFESEKHLQEQKAVEVAAGVRGKSGQITQRTIDAYLVVENIDEWTKWQRLLENARSIEQATEGLFKSVDIRGNELRSMIGNLGFLLRSPGTGSV